MTLLYFYVNIISAVKNCFLCFSSFVEKPIVQKGGRNMNKYEVLYIISADTAEEKREELIKKFSSFVESKGGVVNGIDKWGMKKLAYPINFKNEGFYVLMNFELAGTEVDGLKKLMTITEAVVRVQIVRKQA